MRPKMPMLLNCQREAFPMIPWRQLLPALALLLTTRSVQAQNTDAKDRAAKKACLAGEFPKGVAILSELYVSTGDPTFIFNQGRCFEQNHRYEDAIARFQEYLRVGKRLGKADKTRAQTHISDCENLLAKQGALQAAVVPTSGGSIEAREKSAMRACLTGDAAAGVAILTDLFIETKVTTYLFNQGRCFEQNRQYEEAVGRFREYLIKTKNLSPEHKADTDKHIAACESYLQDKTKAPATTKPEQVEPIERRPVVPSRPPELVVASPTAGRAGSTLRTTGAILALAGGAGLATGLVLNLKANSMSDDVEKLYDDGVDSSRKRFETASWIAYGVGATCLATGAVLYYLGWRRGERMDSLALIPTLGPETAGAVLGGSF